MQCTALWILLLSVVCCCSARDHDAQGWSEVSRAAPGGHLEGAPPVEDYATDDYPDNYDDSTNTSDPDTAHAPGRRQHAGRTLAGDDAAAGERDQGGRRLGAPAL